MELIGKMLFMGSEARPSFKDPTKMIYQVAFMQGLDSMRSYVDAAEYPLYQSIAPLTPVEVVYDYTPGSNGLRVIDVRPATPVSDAAHSPAASPASDKKAS